MRDQIFISYRRDDAAYVTGHINDLLRKEFGEESVFTDVDNIALGVDFRAVLDETVSQCHVLLAVIGSEWLTVRDQDGRLRLQDPADFVRIEIESALKRNIPVIPLLVAGATMPVEEQLPESLRGLAYRNGIQIRPAPDFSADMARLVRNLRHHFDSIRDDDDEPEGVPAESVEEAGATAEQPQASDAALHFEVDEEERARHRAELERERKKSRRASLVTMAVIAAALAGGAYWYFSGGSQEMPQQAPAAANQPIAEPEPERAEALAAPDETASEADPVPELLAEIAIEPAERSVIDLAPEPVNEPVTEIAAEPVAEAAPASEVVRAPDVSEFIGEGVRLAAIGNHEAAIRSFDEAIAIDPEAAFVYKQRGTSYQALGNFEAAISDFDEVIRLNSEDVNAYYRRGVSHHAVADYSAAVADFDAVIERDPEFVDAYSRRADAHEALGNDEAAARDRSAIAETAAAEQ